MTLTDSTTTATTVVSTTGASSIVTACSFDAKEDLVTMMRDEEATKKSMLKRSEGSMDATTTVTTSVSSSLAAPSSPSSSSSFLPWLDLSSWGGGGGVSTNKQNHATLVEEEQGETTMGPVPTSKGENTVEVPHDTANGGESNKEDNVEKELKKNGGEQEEDEEDDDVSNSKDQEDQGVPREKVFLASGDIEGRPFEKDAKVRFEESRFEKNVEEDGSEKVSMSMRAGLERNQSLSSDPTAYRSPSKRHLFDSSMSSNLSAPSLPHRRAKDMESSQERRLVKESLRAGLLFQGFPSARIVDTSDRGAPSSIPEILEELALQNDRFSSRQDMNHHKARKKLHQRVHELFRRGSNTPENVTLLEMCYLSEIIYKCHDQAGEWDALTYDLQDVSHVLLGKGIRQNITWMVTTCGNTTHVILKGFDASDPRIDRVALLKDGGQATATYVQLSTSTKEEEDDDDDGKVQLALHGRLWEMAQALYQKDIRPFLLSTMEQQGGEKKLSLLGHSLGGSLSIMLLLLLYRDYGVDLVRSKVQHVHTFGTPPVVCLVPRKNATFDNTAPMELAGGDQESNTDDACPVLQALGLPTDMVMGYNQPWDPFVRMFTPYDVLYPLAANVQSTRQFGPRYLRPITGRLIRKSAEFDEVGEQFVRHGRPFASLDFDDDQTPALAGFCPVGRQYVLLSSSRKYLRDRFGGRGRPYRSPAVPTPHALVQVSCQELLALLHSVYPIAPDYHLNKRMDTMVRSLWHHIPDSYTIAVVKYLERQQEKTRARTRTTTTTTTTTGTTA